MNKNEPAALEVSSTLHTAASETTSHEALGTPGVAFDYSYFSAASAFVDVNGAKEGVGNAPVWVVEVGVHDFRVGVEVRDGFLLMRLDINVFGSIFSR